MVVPKEFNVWRHYETNYAKQYSLYIGLLTDEQANKLIVALKKQFIFIRSHQMKKFALKASKCHKGNSNLLFIVKLQHNNTLIT